MIINMGLNVAFVFTLLQTGYLPAHVGLALATSAAAYYNAFRLARGLRRDQLLGPAASFAPTLLKILGACIAMSLLVYFMLPAFDAWSAWRWHERLLELFLVIGAAVLCYAAMLWIMGFRRQHFLA